MATTRLDRLFLLLESGSTTVVRKSAAEQLGQVQKLYPHELNNLLNKVHKYLCSNNWETRIAAGQAVEAIVKNVPQWCPLFSLDDEDEKSPHPDNGSLSFSQFDLQKVMLHGQSLLGSEGDEYDDEEPLIGLDEKERLTRQKHLLNKKLGLDVAGGIGIPCEPLFDDEDLIVRKQTHREQQNQKSHSDLVLQQQMMGQMSARERNRAKRKAKLLSKQISREDKVGMDTTPMEPTAKQRKMTSVLVEQPADDDKVVIDNVVDHTLNLEELDEWPFEGFCELLLNELFSSSWEKRHGASVGLREVLKLHGKGAGKIAKVCQSTMHSWNQEWLEDVSVRFVCVLALDRFGDYVSDEVVAPVRETCAQNLGIILKYLDETRIVGVVHALLRLLSQPQWEVRHGGLLGIKYLLAVRQDQTEQLLPVVLPAVFAGLQDRDNDVRAVAAAALVPISESLVKYLPQQVPIITSCLWEILTDLDDLTASTNSVMSLLSTLLTFNVSNIFEQHLSMLVPRLWPFMKHNISSVRKATLQTIHTLLQHDSTQSVVAFWLIPILQDALRHVFQRCLLEDKEDVLILVYKVWGLLLKRSPLSHLVAAVGPWLGVWFCLIMQPVKMPFDNNMLIQAKHMPKEVNVATARHRLHESQQSQSTEQKNYIGGNRSLTLPAYLMDVTVMKIRVMASKCLGLLAYYLSQPLPNVPEGMETPLESFSKVLLFHLSSKSAMQRLVAAFVIRSWAELKDEISVNSEDNKECINPCSCPDSVKNSLLGCLSESIYYDEIAVGFTKMQRECQDFVATLSQFGVTVDNVGPIGTVLSLEQAMQLCSGTVEQDQITLQPPHQQMVSDKRKSLQATVSQISNEWHTLHNRVQCSLAGCCISLNNIPNKLNPVIRPMMDSLKKEENHNIQETNAGHLSKLLKECAAKSPNPNAKVVKNLCNMLCSDPQQTPFIDQEDAITSAPEASRCDHISGILTLMSSCGNAEKLGRRGAPSKKPSNVSNDIPVDVLVNEEDQERKLLLIQKRGALFALNQITKDNGSDLPTHCPSLWETMMQPLNCVHLSQESDSNGNSLSTSGPNELITCLQVLETVLPSMDKSLHEQILEKLPQLSHCLKHKYSAVRHMASRAIGVLARVTTGETMNYILENVIPNLGATDKIRWKKGGIECIANIIERLGVEVLPYIVLLIVPVLGCMNDQDEPVRLMATQSFATLIKLMPLESGVPDPPTMLNHLAAKKEKERKFLEQLLDTGKITDFKVPVPVKAELRRYQQEGVNWLAFLKQYKLHGILCDDMGLGKTLQSLCILAGDHHSRELKYKESGDADSKPLPSIVVCPPTLTGHWVYEVEKFVDSKYLIPLHYTGTPTERTKLQKTYNKYNLVIASYDIVRNDIDFFGDIKWNYCILDEGHIIKNGKTKISKAVKQLTCNHRLILSGTPIQNNVLELWSLFDFLMPGFLGTEKQFQARYGRPILQSRDAKCSSKEQEAGALAMEALHRQVLPFLLRRLKEDVLKDLPPKIIQDYYCDLSPLQVRLYEDFAKSRAKRSLDDTVTTMPKTEEQGSKLDLQNRSHIFQALQYLRKVCNHPALALNKQHPQYDDIMRQLSSHGTNIRDIQHAPKLTALRQLLQDCGIGVASGIEPVESTPVCGQHRVLLFCQLKSMLDIVEQDLFKKHMPTVTYMRLDGSVPAGSRVDIVNKFNNDPSIDILLLTTHVGGLGLNLTGADTVIFVEHDWNPMKDLQAMDRAHRIGQKKVVTVYRLITKWTLEEKIMGLQKFKLNIANTVISQENSSLASMGTDQLLDLFSLESSSRGSATRSSEPTKTGPGKTSTSAILEQLGELWDEKQYENEYDMNSFMKSLSNI